MPRLTCLRILAAIAVLSVVTGCTTTQPVAQNTTSTAAKKYYSEETPQTGSHIARRYSADDPNRPADSTASYTPISGQPLGGPVPSGRGN